jgi:hypothetical protein
MRCALSSVISSAHAVSPAQVADVKKKFGQVMVPYAERCHDALEPYREQARAQRERSAASASLLTR